MKGPGLRLPRSLFSALALLLVLSGGLGVSLRAARAGKGRVAFLRLTEGYWQVWLMAPNGTAARQITSSPVDKYSISWCSENRVLHFYTALGDTTFVDLETGRTRTAVPPAAIRPRGPFGEPLSFELNPRQWAIASGRVSMSWPNCGEGEIDEVVALRSPAGLPQGMLVAIQKTVGKDEKTRFRIGVVDEHHVGELILGSPNGRMALSHRVVSSNREAAFVSDREGALEVWRIGSDGSRARLSDMGVDVGSLSWSSDGRFLYFDAAPSGVRQIFRMSADGGELVQLTHGKTPSRSPVFSSPEAP
jgi:hypothetical protein